MPDPDPLPPAATAFLAKWCPSCNGFPSVMFADLAALLAEARAEERELAAAQLEAAAARIRGDRKRVPQVDVWVMSVLEREAGKIRGGE